MFKPKYISTFILLFTLMNMSLLAHHGPRFQLIHAVADESLADVDVYIGYQGALYNPGILVENFQFNDATEYWSSGTLIYGDVELFVVPAGMEPTFDNVLLYKSFGQPEVDYEETHVLVMTGEPGNGLDLYLSDGLEATSSPNTVSIKAFHGASDAPEVNILDVSGSGGMLVENLAFGEAQGYLNLAATDRTLQVQTLDGTAVANFSVPLSFFAGKTVMLAATGYLDTTGVTPNEPFKLIAADQNGVVAEILPMVEEQSTARVQVIHNSADVAAGVVDIWLNDVLLLDNFAYLTASPFIDAPAGEVFTISVKDANSSSPSNPIWSKDYLLSGGSTYTLIAEGIVSGSGYDPATPFDLSVNNRSREASLAAGTTDVLVHHGSSDAPLVNITEIGTGLGVIIEDLVYGDFSEYFELPTLDYRFKLLSDSYTDIATYDAPLASLGLDGQAITVIASGFLNPENNSNGSAFGLWVALADGGPLVELPLIPQTPYAYVQVIHNSADAAAEVVDVWMNDILLLDNFSFRTASPGQLGIPADEAFTLSIKGPESTDASNPLWTEEYILETNQNYILIAEGIVSASGYEPAVPFGISVYDMGRNESSTAGTTDLLIHHGATDAPVVDVHETGVGVGMVVNDLMYGDYAGYLELNTMDYMLEIRDQTSASVVAAYDAPLQSLNLEGMALTVIASGFYNPANNSNGPAFGLWVAFPSGGAMIELPRRILASVEEDTPLTPRTFTLEQNYPNPFNPATNIRFGLPEAAEISLAIYDVRGNEVRTMESAARSAGWYEVKWNGRNNQDQLVDTGVYFARITAGGYSDVIKMTYLK